MGVLYRQEQRGRTPKERIKQDDRKKNTKNQQGQI